MYTYFYNIISVILLKKSLNLLILWFRSCTYYAKNIFEIWCDCPFKICKLCVELYLCIFLSTQRPFCFKCCHLLYICYNISTLSQQSTVNKNITELLREVK